MVYLFIKGVHFYKYNATCDGCMSGLAEMYQDYIDGKKELREINMEFNARYVKDDDMEVRGSGCMMGY